MQTVRQNVEPGGCGAGISARGEDARIIDQWPDASLRIQLASFTDKIDLLTTGLWETMIRADNLIYGSMARPAKPGST